MVHVDDIILSGTLEFMIMMGDTLKSKFRISKDQFKKFSYIGMALRCEAGDIYMNQNQYIEELENVPEGIEEQFSSEKMKEFLKPFKVNILTRISPSTDLKEKIKEARRLVKEIKATQVEIKFSRLGDLSELYLEVYVDAAFGNTDNKVRSTEGAIIMLRGVGSRCSPAYWTSKKTRVCKSAKTAETVALENAVDMAICIGRQLNQIRTGVAGKDPGKIVVCSDSKSLIESLSSTKQVKEGPMRLSIERLKDFRDHGEVTEFKWVPTGDMLADALTKQRVDAAVLVRVLRTGRLRNP